MEIVAVVAALVGVVLGDRLAYLRERATRKHEFVRRQVEEFYSPLAGIRHEIRAKSELRVRISSAADAAWRRLCDEVRDEAHELQALSDERFPEFKKIIEYNNQQLAGDLLPSYRKMLDLFREKYWLSNDSTRQHYGALVERVRGGLESVGKGINSLGSRRGAES